MQSSVVGHWGWFHDLAIRESAAIRRSTDVLIAIWDLRQNPKDVVYFLSKPPSIFQQVISNFLVISNF